MLSPRVFFFFCGLLFHMITSSNPLETFDQRTPTEYISTLEGDIAERDRLLEAIRNELGSSRNENLALRREVENLKRVLLDGRGQLPPPSHFIQPLIEIYRRRRFSRQRIVAGPPPPSRSSPRTERSRSPRGPSCRCFFAFLLKQQQRRVQAQHSERFAYLPSQWEQLVLGG